MTGFEGRDQARLGCREVQEAHVKRGVVGEQDRRGTAQEIQEPRQGLRQRRLSPDHRIRDAVDVRHARRDRALRIDQLLPGAQFQAVEPKPHGAELHDPVDDREQPSRLQVEGDELDFG